MALTGAGVADSKRLSPARRGRLAALIARHATATAVGLAPAATVDREGLLHATALAMQRALEQLREAPDYILLDGLPLRELPRRHTAIVRGDACCLSIAAASIVAKVTRDTLMAELDDVYPGYHFAAHKGYGTASHRRALHELGPCPIHRFSYVPVAAIVAQSWV